MMPRLELTGVEQHHPSADGWEGVRKLEIIEDGTFGNNILKQSPQIWDIRLTVAELVDQAVLGFCGRDVKRLIESAIGGSDAQCGVEDQQRLSHRIDDVLSVGFDGLQIR